MRRIIVLAEEAPADWDGDWMADVGRGLNPELEQARKLVAGDLIVLHADLPLLTPGDVTALIEAASESGLAIAPDRHRTGTHGLALRSEEHTSELQSLLRNSIAVFCLKKQKSSTTRRQPTTTHDVTY